MKQILLFTGGLGNQLFQYTFILYMKYCCNIDLYYNTSFYKKYNIHSGFQANKVFSLEELQEDNTNFYNNIFFNIRRFRNLFNIKNRLLMCNDYTFENSSHPKDFKIYEGYWQNKKYYLNVKEELEKRQLPLNNNSVDEKIEYKIHNSNSVFIHIRRGDYCNDPKYVDLSTTKYYDNSIKWIKQQYGDDHLFFVFSDDINWARKYFHYKGIIFVEYEHQTALSDLYLMSICKSAIIANSSFSWWSAVLGKKKNILFPRNYYTDGTQVDIYLDGWHGIGNE